MRTYYDGYDFSEYFRKLDGKCHRCHGSRKYCFGCEPPCSAYKYPHKAKRGLDGRMYVSTTDKCGRYRWVLKKNTCVGCKCSKRSCKCYYYY